VVTESGPKKKMYTNMAENNPKSSLKHQIDENLKRIYEQTLQEPLPDRMLQLLQQLRDKAEVNTAKDAIEAVPREDGDGHESV